MIHLLSEFEEDPSKTAVGRAHTRFVRGRGRVTGVIPIYPPFDYKSFGGYNNNKIMIKIK